MTTDDGVRAVRPPLDDLGPPASPPGPSPADLGWKRNKQGKEYITVQGRRGNVYRRGQESIEEARERAQRPPDDKPKAKAKRRRPTEPDKPKDADLRAVEQALAEALRSPAMVAGLAGDVYLANHFSVWGPRLARNLVVSAEHNPWLRRQLESMASGGAAAMTVMSLIGLAGGILCYVAPPIIYLFNLPAPEMAREMFQIPERRNGTGPPQTAGAHAAAAA